MKKYWWIFVLIALFFFMIGKSVGTENYPGGIAGKAFIDVNANQALDPHKDTPVNGLKVILYREKRNAGEDYMVPVAETTVKDGEYRFPDLSSGEYIIGVRYSDSDMYQMRFNSVFMVNGGNVKVKRGRTTIGPIILLSQARELG